MFTAAAEGMKAECLGKKNVILCHAHSVNQKQFLPTTFFIWSLFAYLSSTDLSENGFYGICFPPKTGKNTLQTSSQFHTVFIGRPVIAVTDLLFYVNLFKMAGEAEL